MRGRNPPKLAASNKEIILIKYAFGCFLVFCLFLLLPLSPLRSAHAVDQDIKGKIHISHGDNDQGQASDVEYHLEETSTKRFHKVNRKVQDDTLELESGDDVIIRGTKRLSGSSRVIDATSIKKDKITEVPATRDLITPSTTTSQTFLVMLVNLTDAQVTVTAEQINGLIFGSTQVAGLYNEMSFGRTQFSGVTVSTPVTINFTKSQGCQYYQWASAADALISQQGVTLTNYKHRVYVMPDLSSMCSNYWGYSTFGGNPSRSWLFKSTVADLDAHELGHALSSHHAGILNGSEYGDTSDIMGWSGIGLRHMNAPHKHQMGWVSGSSLGDVTTSGTYVILPLEIATTAGVQVLRVFRPSTNDYLYISYRVPFGYDSTLRTAYVNKVNIHTYKGSGVVVTRFLTALDVGQSYTDAGSNTTIKVLSRDGGGATVQITK